METENITKVLYEENINCLPAPEIIKDANNLPDSNNSTIESYKVYFRNFTSKNSTDSDTLTLIDMYYENLTALIEVLS